MDDTPSSIHSDLPDDNDLDTGDNRVNKSQRKRALERDDLGGASAKRLSTLRHIRVLQILESTATGIILLDEYKQMNLLSAKSSIRLCNLIIEHVVVKSSVHLSKYDFLQLREQIIQIFPNEDPDVCYIMPVPKLLSPLRKSERAKGRLYERYRNVSKMHRGLEKSETATSDEEIDALREKYSCSNYKNKDEYDLKYKEFLKKIILYSFNNYNIYGSINYIKVNLTIENIV